MLWIEALINMINQRVLARARMRCLKPNDSFCFQNVLSNEGGDGKNDTGLLTNHVGVI